MLKPFPGSTRMIPGLIGAALLLFAAIAAASGTAPPPPPRQEPPTPSAAVQPEQPSAEDQAKAARAEAEKLYAKGYDIAQEAKKADEVGKQKDAKKKFGKALKQFEGAVERDPAYYQAWNMMGFCSRHVGDFKRAFASYEKCLSIKPDYDEAHEYLGEAYLQTGNLDQAKVQLAWLRAHDSDEAGELAEKIEAVEHKEQTKEKPAPTPGEDKPAPAAASGQGSGS
jgi:tetratricopeptide (TPR) repeat protein